jgi:hypothetical protein
MSMEPFYTKFPKLAAKEMRTAFLQNYPGLPDGAFGFVESYCDEDGCDCRRVMIDVLTPETKDKAWATIGFGWESVEYYRKWVGCSMSEAKEHKGPILDPLNPQTEYAPALLRLFQDVVRDREYVERLKRHYRLFKSKPGTEEGVDGPGAEMSGWESASRGGGPVNVSPNDYCPCGSEKKYKKCCGASPDA